MNCKHQRNLTVAVALTASIAAVGFTARFAHAVQLADWTFETSSGSITGVSPLSGNGVAAELGVNATTSFANANLTGSTDTHGNGTLSSPAGNGTAHSISANGWDTNDYFQFTTSMAGYTNLSLSWDETSSNTGPKNFKLQYSTNGTTFTDFTGTVVGVGTPANGSTNGTWVVAPNTGTTAWSASGSPNAATSYTANLGAITALNNAATVYIRLVNYTTSAAAAAGGNTAASGTDRVDNFIINGAAGKTWNTTSGTWDTSSINWLDANNAPAAFANADIATFANISADSTITVTSTPAITASSITVSNTANTYTFTGPGNVTSTNAFTKTGAGNLVINNTITASSASLSGGTVGGTGTLSAPTTFGLSTTISPGAAIVAGNIGTLTFGNLALSADPIMFDVASTASHDLVSVANLSVTGGNVVTVNDMSNGGAGGTLTAGNYPLFNYSGTFTGSQASFVVSTPTIDGLYATFINNTGTHTIDLVLSVTQPAANTFTWTGGTGGSGTAWLTGLNWDVGTAPTAFDIAVFTTTSAGTPIGINMNGATNNGSHGQAIGEIVLNSAATADRIITNSSSATAGTLTIYGAGGTLLSNSSPSNKLTLQNGASTALLNIALPNVGNVEVTNAAATIEIDAQISGAGGITKTGLGTLILTGANNYSGGTIVSAGKLLASGALAGTTTVNGSATLGVSSGTATGTLNLANLTLNNQAILAFNLDTVVASDKIVVSGTLASGGTSTVNINGTTNFTTGSYDLINFATGSLTNANFSLGTLPVGFSAHFNVTTNDVFLVVTGGPNLIFLGNSTTWDQPTINWNTEDTTPVASSWNDDGIHNAVFNGTDTLTAPVAITVSGTRTVNQLQFSNKVYTLSGGTINLNSGITASESATINSDINLNAAQNWSVATGKTLTIGGNLSGAYLTKTGPGTLDLTNALSGNYLGLIVSAGSVVVNKPGQLGQDPSVSLNGGAIVLAAGYVDDASHGFAIGAAGGTINLTSTITLTIDVNALDISGAGVLTKDGPGTLILGSTFATGTTQAYTGPTVYVNAGILEISATDDVKASRLGSANINVNVNKLSGTLTPGSGGTLQLGDVGVDVQLGSATTGTVGFIDLYDGATFVAGGHSSITHITTSGHASSLSAVRGADAAHINNVTMTTLAGAVLTLNDLVGQFSVATPTDYTGASNATIHLTGSGTIILAPTAALSTANNAFAGSWSLESGTLRIAQPAVAGTFDVLNSLGFQAGVQSTASTAIITVSGGTFELATNTDHLGALSALPAAVVMNGGTIAGTGPLDANGARFGGAFTVMGTGSTVLLYDPESPSTSENVALVGSGAANWQATLTVDPIAPSHGKFIISSTGTATVGAAGKIVIDSSATVELQGTTALYDTTAKRGVAINVTPGGKLNATSGTSRVGDVSGSGTVTVTGATLNATSITGNPVTIASSGKVMLSKKTVGTVSEIPVPTIDGTSALDVTDNPLLIQGTTLSAVQTLITNGTSGGVTSSLLTSPAGLTAVTGTQFHSILGNGATIGGVTVPNDATDVLVLWKADINMDGIVSLADLNLLDYAYVTGGTGSAPFITDINGDGHMDYNDYTAMYLSVAAQGNAGLAGQIYNEGTTLFGGAFQASVPEPASLALLGLGAAGLMFRKRK